MINPKENVNAITLKGGKQLDEMPQKAREDKDSPIEKDEATTPIESGGPPKNIFKDPIPPIAPALPFPSRFANTKKREGEGDLGYFSKSPSQHSSC